MKYADLKYLVLGLFLCACSPEDGSETQEREFEDLQRARIELEQIAQTTACTDGGECRAVAFGSKPCGGPWSYLAYNSSLESTDFLDRIAQYNAAEDAYNLKWGVVSDCMAVGPPTRLDCVDGQCTAIYE
jgi:hypothetical protein